MPRHNMNVRDLSIEELQAIVLGLRTVLSFEITHLRYDQIYDIAYNVGEGQQLFLQLMKDEN